MSDNDNHRAADYVLGALSAEERAKISRAAAVDPKLAGDIAFWNERLAAIAGHEEIEPPADMFARIQAAIATRRTSLPGTLTVRDGEGAWETLADGVERKMLWSNGPNGRITFLVRMAPGARYAAHAHDDDEECYVVSGDITFDTLKLQGGDYHLAFRGNSHPAAFTVDGCLLLVTAAR